MLKYTTKRVLVCDDDLGISEVVKIMLEGEGYEVMVVGSGKAIVSKAIQFQPNLIFLDIWMPGIDGREVIKLLHSDPKTKKIPIVVMSALNNAPDIAINSGVQACLSKPFDMDNLLQLTAKLV